VRCGEAEKKRCSQGDGASEMPADSGHVTTPLMCRHGAAARARFLKRNFTTRKVN
jgi:hypothetical protein